MMGALARHAEVSGRRTWPCLAVAALGLCLLVMAGCSSGSKASTSAGSGADVGDIGAGLATEPGVSGLRAAARAYAQAWLTGTASEIEGLRANAPCGPNGAPISANTPTLNSSTLAGLRSQITRAVGRPLAEVHITSVDTRAVTATRGEAEAIYDLPESAAGNDNWLEYRYVDGRWRVDDCKLTIGGSGAHSSGGSSAPKAPSASSQSATSRGSSAPEVRALFLAAGSVPGQP